MSGNLTVAVYSIDAPEHACARVRLLGPLRRARRPLDVVWAARPLDGRLDIDLAAAESADVVVVQRLFPQPSTRDVLEHLDGLDVPVIYELDDLFAGLEERDPLAALTNIHTGDVEAMLERADVVTVPTPELAGALSRFARDVRVLPNQVDVDLFSRPVPGADLPVEIMHAGTPGHQSDLELVEEAILRVQEEFCSVVRFTLVGPTTPRLRALPETAVRAFDPSYEGYACWLSSCDAQIALVPLRDLPSNRCKSDIKWLEYSACGIAGVYADLPPYTSSVQHGETGLLVPPDPAEWATAISELVRDPQRRAAIAAHAQRRVRQRRSLGANADAFVALYTEVVARHRRGDDATRTSTTRPVEPPAPRPDPIPIECSVIIPVFNRADLTRQCLAAIEDVIDRPSCEVIVVDNGSTDETEALLESFTPRLRVLRNPTNLGFARACNRAAREARGDFLVFLNNDTIPRPGWLDELVEEARSDRAIAMVGSKLLYPDGRVQAAGVFFCRHFQVPAHGFSGVPGNWAAADRRRELRAVSAACVLVRRSAFESAEGFDERYRNGFEDIDLCLTIGRQGGKIVYQPQSVVVHLEEQTPGRKDFDAENLALFRERWSDAWIPDEDLFYFEAGCKVGIVEYDGRACHMIEWLVDPAERDRWEAVAVLQRCLLDDNGEAVRALLSDPLPLPEDPTVLEWIEGLRAQLGLEPPAPEAREDPDPPLHVLLVAHSFTTQALAGTEIYTAALAQELQRRGHRVEVLHPRQPEAGESIAAGEITESEHRGIPVATLTVPPSDVLDHQFRRDDIAQAVGRFVERRAPDVVHVQHLIGLGMTALEACAAHAPVVLSLHDPWLLCFQGHFVRWDGSFCTGPETVDKCVRCAGAYHPELSQDELVPHVHFHLACRRQAAAQGLRAVDTVVATSEFLRDRMRAFGLDHPHTELAPLGLAPFPTAERVPRGAGVRFTYLGNVCRTKGLDVAIRAFNLVDSASGGGAELAIHGNIQEAPYFEECMREVDPERKVHYAGAYKPDALPDILANTDVAVIPSRAENYPTVVRECLHAGVPVIASDVGAMSELIEHGVTGRLFPSCDSEALAACMQLFCDRPETIEEYRARIRPVRTIEDDAGRLLGIYRETLSRPRRGN